MRWPIQLLPPGGSALEHHQGLFAGLLSSLPLSGEKGKAGLRYNKSFEKLKQNLHNYIDY